MTRPDAEPYPILEIQPDWVLESEAMGSKRKFWYRESNDQTQWLFKYPQPKTGQHWSEKIAAEVAHKMGIPRARVEFARFQGIYGSATESFVRDGLELYHGNQVLAGWVLGYDPQKDFMQKDHTFDNISLALDRTFKNPSGALKAKQQLNDYLVLDALVGNTDRHHENWGILRKPTGEGWVGFLAPTFDHASSIGRELVDHSAGKSREKLLKERRIGQYSEKARGAIFWEATDTHAVSPLELVRRAAARYPEQYARSFARLESVSRKAFEEIVDRVPAEWMSPLSRTFAVELMCYNLEQLREIAT